MPTCLAGDTVVVAKWLILNTVGSHSWRTLLNRVLTTDTISNCHIVTCLLDSALNLQCIENLNTLKIQCRIKKATIWQSSHSSCLKEHQWPSSLKGKGTSQNGLMWWNACLSLQHLNYMLYTSHGLTSKWTYTKQLSFLPSSHGQMPRMSFTTLIGTWWQLPVCLSGLSSSTLRVTTQPKQALSQLVVIHYSLCLKLPYNCLSGCTARCCSWRVKTIPCVWKLAHIFTAKPDTETDSDKYRNSLWMVYALQYEYFMEHSIGLNREKEGSHDHHVTFTSGVQHEYTPQCW